MWSTVLRASLKCRLLVTSLDDRMPSLYLSIPPTSIRILLGCCFVRYLHQIRYLVSFCSPLTFVVGIDDHDAAVVVLVLVEISVSLCLLLIFGGSGRWIMAPAAASFWLSSTLRLLWCWCRHPTAQGWEDDNLQFTLCSCVFVAFLSVLGEEFIHNVM